MSPVYRHILRDILSIFPSEPFDSSYLQKDDHRAENRLIHFNRWFIRMRWVVCIVSIVISILAIELGYLEKDALWPLIATIMCLAASNVLYALFLRLGRSIRVLMDMQMFSDLAILTAMIHFSGGIENPLFFAYIFHIIIGSIILDRRKCYIMVAVASVLFSALIFS